MKAARWTDEETDALRALWRRSDLRGADVAAMLGRPLRAVYVKEHRIGLPSKPDPNAIRLTREQEGWLKCNFPHMRTEFCAGHLGISIRSCVRIARRLGLEKTEEFMRQCQTVTARLAKESHLRNGTYPPKGVVNANLAKGEMYRFGKKRSPVPMSGDCPDPY